jgi:hypothetical protein
VGFKFIPEMFDVDSCGYVTIENAVEDANAELINERPWDGVE